MLFPSLFLSSDYNREGNICGSSCRRTREGYGDIKWRFVMRLSLFLKLLPLNIAGAQCCCACKAIISGMLLLKNSRRNTKVGYIYFCKIHQDRLTNRKAEKRLKIKVCQPIVYSEIFHDSGK
jgi:hypothetical protein